MLCVVVLLEYLYSPDNWDSILDEEDLALVQGEYEDQPRLTQHGCQDQDVHSNLISKVDETSECIFQVLSHPF